MKSLPCNLVLLPSEELADKAIIASKVLSGYESLFTLRVGDYYPHLSLYMFQLNEADIPRVKEILAETARAYRVVHGEARKYYLGEGHAVGYIDAEYEITDGLRSLQDRVIALVNPIRAGMREKDVAKMQDATGAALQNLQQYGYPAVGSLFRPHLTLTRLKSYKPEVLNELPDIATFKGDFSKIGLFEMGDNGTCVREIATFELLP